VFSNIFERFFISYLDRHHRDRVYFDRVYLHPLLLLAAVLSNSSLTANRTETRNATQ